MASKELKKIREDIEITKWYKANHQSYIEYYEQEIAGCQKSINDPSTDENERERLKGVVEEYEGGIQRNKQRINRRDKEIIALREKEGSILAISDVKNRDLFKAAMRGGHIKFIPLGIGIFGYAGSGKSHVLALMLGEPPPRLRISTACATKPVRAISHSRIGRGGRKFKRICDKDYSKMMMKTAKDGCSEPTGTKFKLSEKLRVIFYSPPKPTDEVEKDLIVDFHQPGEDVESLEDQTVGDVTDSGGQPQFLEILPRFIDNLSLGILVTDLSQRLDDYPVNYYFNNQGQSVGEGVKSSLTNEQILRRFMQMIASKSQGSKRVRFVFVGTHRDLEHMCTESREEKNRKLKDMVKSFGLEDSVIYQDQHKLIFALNAKEPEDVDHQRADELVDLMMDASGADSITIPVSYYGVESTLKQKVQESNQIAFPESEILSLVSHYHFNEESLKEALRYLHDIKRIFYFEEDFPGVVIGEPQAVLDKLTELVAYHIELTTNPKKQRALEGKWKKFSQCGILDIECLKKFPGQYVEGVFSPADMMKLFEKLFIVSEVNQGEYLMPCVLPMDPQTSCNPECETQLVPPMVLHFTKGVPRHGIYCGTICHVMTEAKWKLLEDPTTGKPFHITRNSVHFSLPCDPVKITINDSLDSFFLITVHVSPDASYDAESISCMCTMIHNTLVKAINEVTEKLNYSPDSPKVAFLCEKHKTTSLHPAVMSEYGSNLTCTKHHIKGGTLTDQHRVWLKGVASSAPPKVPLTRVTSPHPPPPDSTSVHQTGVTSPHLPPPDSTPVHHIPSSLYSYAPPQTASSKKATSHNLSTADHFKVAKILEDLNNVQLIRLGTALGLRYPHLQRMQILPDDMVAAWLNIEDEVMDISGIPTWSSLIKALEDTDQKGVASRIRKEQHSNHPK